MGDFHPRYIERLVAHRNPQAGAGCVGLAIQQPGWAVAFSLDGWMKITYDRRVVLRKVSTFFGELQTLLQELTSLNWLGLEGNQLITLPTEIFKGTPSLQALYLRNNHLRFLPEAVLEELSSLQSLDLSNNHLRFLPETVFRGLSSLQWIDLTYNRLDDLSSPWLNQLCSSISCDLYED